MRNLTLRAAAPAIAALAAAALGLIGAGSASADTTTTVTVCASGCEYTTIQAAVDNASDGATIKIAAGSYGGFTVPGGLTGVTLKGAGAGQTIVVPAVGGNAEGTVTISSGASVTIKGVTITDADGYQVGGIKNSGTLTLDDSTVSGNPGWFGGIGTHGSGINNEFGTLTLNDSTVSDNGNTGMDFGGGIYNQVGTVTLNDSTVSGNTGQDGGGIDNVDGTVTLTDSTVSGNTAITGGGIDNDGAATLYNSTVSGNTPDNCSGSPVAGCSG